ncbi:hypothetical protein [Tardiphaga sp. 709]|uniref:hypothetical protein n=1 Tax=Tardiphaga sp. 709 TaxID=3076039 RepID=UPI0028EEB6ED|nr:hypothetical protein [Tardiphaga sp. 709]
MLIARTRKRREIANACVQSSGCLIFESCNDALPLSFIAQRWLERQRCFHRTLPRAINGLCKILRIEPRFIAHQRIQIPVPDLGHFDIELHIVFLADSLNSVAGDGPLFAEPKNIPMQHHVYAQSRPVSYRDEKNPNPMRVRLY